MGNVHEIEMSIHCVQSNYNIRIDYHNAPQDLESFDCIIGLVCDAVSILLTHLIIAVLTMQLKSEAQGWLNKPAHGTAKYELFCNPFTKCTTGLCRR